MSTADILTLVICAAAFLLVALPKVIVGWRRRLVDSGLALGAKREDYLMAELEVAKNGFRESLNEAKSWQSKFEHAFKSVEQMERERNVWKAMYYSAGLGHAQAQEMLFREIERLSEKAKVPVRDHLKGLVDGYRQEHVLSEEKAEAKVQELSRG